MDEIPYIVNDDFIIHHAIRTGGPHNMPTNHYHNRYEIYFLLNGERSYFIKDRTYQVLKGDIVLIHPNEIHRTIDAGSANHERIVIEFGSSYLHDMIHAVQDIHLFDCFHHDSSIFRLNIEEQTVVQQYLFHILREHQEAQKGAVTYCKSLLIQLLILLNRYIKALNVETYEHPNVVHAKVSDIVKYLNEHYMDDLTLKSVADRFFISPFYLSRVFKEVTGFSFIEYINNIRIREAQRLLHYSKWNITKIADQVGYQSITHFGRVFKSITGFSPSQFRKLKSTP